MPKYKVTDPTSGRTVTLDGDSAPTEQELEEVFKSIPSQPAQPAAQQPQQDQGGIKNPISPNLSKVLDTPYDGSVGGYLKRSLVDVPLATLADVTTLPRRALGAIGSQGEMSNPETSPTSKLLADMPQNTAVQRIEKGLIEGITDPANLVGTGIGSKVKDLVNPLAKGANALAQYAKKIPLKMAEPTLNSAQNSAAIRAGIPLTKAQAQNVVSATKPTGLAANIEAVTRSLPGARGIYAKMNQQQAQAAKNSLGNILGDNLENLDKDFAGDVVSNVDKNVKAAKSKLGEQYKAVTEIGNKAYIDGEDIALKSMDQIAAMPESKNLTSQMADKVQGYIDRFGNIKSNYVKGETGVGRNYEVFKGLVSDLGSEIRATQDKMWQNSAGMNSDQARRYASVLQVVKNNAKEAQYAHLNDVSKGTLHEGLGEELKTLDRNYGDEIGPLNVVKKVFGIGREASEQGFKNEQQAIDNILSGNNSEKLKIAMQYMDDDAKNNLGRAIMAKIIKPSVSTTTTEGAKAIDNIKVQTLSNNFEKYRKQLQQVLGDKKVNQFDDFLTGAKKARLQNINITDEFNSSGTGWKAAIGDLLKLGGTLTGGVGYASHNPLIGVATGLGAMGGTTLGTRQLASYATGIPLTAVEQGMVNVPKGLAKAGLRRLPYTIGSNQSSK